MLLQHQGHDGHAMHVICMYTIHVRVEQPRSCRGHVATSVNQSHSPLTDSQSGMPLCTQPARFVVCRALGYD